MRRLRCYLCPEVTDPAREQLMAMLGKTGAETGFTVPLRRGTFPPGDIADALMPASKKELGKRPAAGKIVGCDS